MKAIGSSRVLAILNLSIATMCPAQILVEPAHEAVFRKAFNTNSNAKPLECAVTPVRPALDFSLRFHAGFLIDLPLSQFRGPHHAAITLLRVSPESGVPAYLASYTRFPDGSTMSAYGHIQGGFAVGEGKYKVEVLVKDDLDRTCRNQWFINAKPDRSERGVRLALRPLTVAGLSSAAISSTLATNQMNFDRLTILVHVEPPSPHLTTLPASDARKLLGSLSALLEQLHARSVRLILFNLEQQKVLFRKDGSTAADVEGVARVISQTRFGLVDYATFRNPSGAMNLLARLTEDELGQLHSSDGLIFLGPHVRAHGALPAGVGTQPRDGARVFYLKCAPPLSLFTEANDSGPRITAASATVPAQTLEDDGAEDIDYADHFSALNQSDNIRAANAYDASDLDQQDGIDRLVRRLKGKTIFIRKPGDCARAIRLITQREGRRENLQAEETMAGLNFTESRSMTH